MSRLFIGELVIFILAVGGGGWSFVNNRGSYFWSPCFIIALIALLMMLKVFFV